jgi:hypothetical protein
MTRHRLPHVGFLAILLALGNVAVARAEVVSICHIPPGDPESARVLTVGAAALGAHLGHGDTAVPDDIGCTAGVGECRADGLLQCTAEGLVCDAVAFPPPEATETSCSDGLDNDCDGSSDSSDADCIAVCPSTSHLRAAIVKQIEQLDACKVEVEIVSLTDQPVRVVAQTVDVPEDVVVDSVTTTSCTTSSTFFRCRHTMVFEYTTSGSFNGSYALSLRDECDPFLDCPLCTSGEEVIPFTLAGASCEVTEVPPPELGEISGALWFDADGDGVRDPEDPDLALDSTLEIFADDDPFDGLPDGDALAGQNFSGVSVESYSFLDLQEGVYVIRLTGPAGTCPSFGPDTDIDPETGLTFPISILETSPPTVVTGVDLALKVCP